MTAYDGHKLPSPSASMSLIASRTLNQSRIYPSKSGNIEAKLPFGSTTKKHVLPWNRNKTIEGSMGLQLRALRVMLILPIPSTILVVLLATAVESLPVKVG
jgi:hypothetical protein